MWRLIFIWIVCGLFNIAVFGLAEGGTESLSQDEIMGLFLAGPIATAVMFMVVIFAVLARLAGG